MQHYTQVQCFIIIHKSVCTYIHRNFTYSHIHNHGARLKQPRNRGAVRLNPDDIISPLHKHAHVTYQNSLDEPIGGGRRIVAMITSIVKTVPIIPQFSHSPQQEKMYHDSRFSSESFSKIKIPSLILIYLHTSKNGPPRQRFDPKKGSFFIHPLVKRPLSFPKEDTPAMYVVNISKRALLLEHLLASLVAEFFQD